MHPLAEPKGTVQDTPESQQKRLSGSENHVGIKPACQREGFDGLSTPGIAGSASSS